MITLYWLHPGGLIYIQLHVCLQRGPEGGGALYRNHGNFRRSGLRRGTSYRGDRGNSRKNLGRRASPRRGDRYRRRGQHHDATPHLRPCRYNKEMEKEVRSEPTLPLALHIGCVKLGKRPNCIFPQRGLL